MTVLSEPALSSGEAPVVDAIEPLPGTGSSFLASAGRRGRRALVDNSGIILVVLAWQLWVAFGSVSVVVMPTPLQVSSDLLGDWRAYVPDLLSTLRSTLAGLVIGCALGLALAVIVHLSPLAKGLVQPTVLIVRSVPMVAMIPVFARIFGYNVTTVIVVSTLVAYFPAYVMAVRGLASASESQADLLAALGGSRWTRFRFIDLPSAMPHLASGLRLAAVASLVGTLLAEFVVGAEGLGHLFILARVSYDMAKSWGVALLGTALSLVLFVLASWIGERVSEAYT